MTFPPCTTALFFALCLRPSFSTSARPFIGIAVFGVSTCSRALIQCSSEATLQDFDLATTPTFLTRALFERLSLLGLRDCSGVCNQIIAAIAGQFEPVFPARSDLAGGSLVRKHQSRIVDPFSNLQKHPLMDAAFAPPAPCAEVDSLRFMPRVVELFEACDAGP